MTATSTGSYSRGFDVYKPDGTYWKSGTTSVTGTLPASGEYSIVFSAASNLSSGPYTVTLTTTQSAPAASTASLVATNDPCTSVANPINFDVGFKAQTEVDYNAGGLTFSRIYRSDSSWTDNTIGYYWRHNYARGLIVTMTTASITDGAGTTTNYTKSGSDWIPDDPSTTATFVTSGSDYLYTLHDGTVETYDSAKKLVRIAYLGGGALNLGYNGSSQLTSITNENGRQLTLTYSSGRVATLITPDGTFSYSYDGNTNLDTVTKPDTKTRQYHYEDLTYTHALTGITDEAGVRFATFGFDANGKADLSKHAGNVDNYTVAYNVNGTSTTTNPLAKDTVYNFQNILGVRRIVQVDGVASASCVASNRYYNYDSLGRVIGLTDWENNTTRYEYDDRSNVTRIVKATNTDEQQTTTITYDPTFNLPDLVTESNRTTDYDYDTYGRMTTMTVTDTATAETRITTYAYDSNTTDPNGNLVLGRLAQIDGPRTDVTDTTDFDYDANLDLTTITNALGQETEITARDSAGRPTTIEDENNVETVLVYDSNGRLQSATVAPGTALEAETDYDYDDNGNLTKVTLPNGVFVIYSYDSAQRLTGIEDAAGNTITYTLDDAGNITAEDVKDSGSVLKYTHGQVFDELSRLLQSVGAAAQTGVYAWDKNSNLTSYTDPETNATGYAYDALQRLVTATDALSGVTTLGYDGLDNLASAEDQRSHTTSFTYNAFGDVISETSPDRGVTNYTVDKAGNVTSKTDALSLVTNYTWDALNRVTFVAYPSDSSLNISLTYDLTVGCGTAGIGRLCSLSDASGVTEYEYNDLGQITDATETRGGLTFATSYTYDLAGNILTMTLPSGRVVTYTRNANGQVSGVSAVVTGSGTTLASSIAYLPFGPLSGLTYGNSLTFTASYDQDYNPTNRTVSTLYNYTYDTDDNDNITQAGTPTYGYDALNRLNTDSTISATSYTYDATSNRLTKVMGGTTSTTVPSTSNKISAVGGTSYTYDAAGNITAIGTSAYVWSAAGLMKEAKLSGSTVGTYTYDYQNRRTKKVAGGVTTHYVYDLNGLLIGEYTSAGALVKEYIYLNGAPLAMIEASSPEVLTYLHVNHLGTPIFGTNTGGTQVWAWAPDVFGNGSPTGSRTVNLRMPGQYYDAESSLFYNWNRYYNPAIGRYISSDPIGIEGGLNTFLYVSASPVMYADPSGNFVPLLIVASAWLEAYAPLAIPAGLALAEGALQYYSGTMSPVAAAPKVLLQGQQCERAIADMTYGLPNITKVGTREANYAGQGGIVGAQKQFASLVNLPGSVVKTNANGTQTVILSNGTRATLYSPTGSPGFSQAIDIRTPNGLPIKIKY